jgi:hypothetical protein
MNENQRKLCRLNVESSSTVSTYPEKKFTSYSNTGGSTYQQYSFN